MPPKFHAARLALLTAVAVMAMPATASAQGFFESLFGLSAKPSAAPGRSAVAPPPSALRGYRTPLTVPERASSHRSDDPSSGDAVQSRSGHYRTLCVRMCDGFYWPVSSSATRSAFYRDAEQCRSTCGTEARLFIQDKAAGDTSGMVDLTGRAYAHLTVAFLYRKRLVSGCTCKPEPWTASELDRHRQYAVAAASSSAAQPYAGGPTVDLPKVTAKADAAQSGGSENAEAREIETPRAGGADEQVAALPIASSVGSRKEIAPAHSRARPARYAKSTRPTDPLARDGNFRGKPRPQLTRVARKAAPAGIFGLGAKPARWPGD